MQLALLKSLLHLDYETERSPEGSALWWPQAIPSFTQAEPYNFTRNLGLQKASAWRTVPIPYRKAELSQSWEKSGRGNHVPVQRNTMTPLVGELGTTRCGVTPAGHREVCIQTYVSSSPQRALHAFPSAPARRPHRWQLLCRRAARGRQRLWHSSCWAPISATCSPGRREPLCNRTARKDGAVGTALLREPSAAQLLPPLL